MDLKRISDLRHEAAILYDLLTGAWEYDADWEDGVQRRIKAIAKYATVKDLWNAVIKKQEGE